MTREKALAVLLDGLTDDEFHQLRRQHTCLRHLDAVNECAEAFRASEPVPPGTAIFDAEDAASVVANETGRSVRWVFNGHPRITHPTATSQEPS